MRWCRHAPTEGPPDACGAADAVRDEETGGIVEGTEADVFSLRVGDCMDMIAIGIEVETEVDAIPTVPCDEPHDSEVYARTELPDGELPGQDEAFAAGDEFCYAEFETFIGVNFDTSEIYLQTMAPTAQSRDAMDDRQILCIAVDSTTT